MTAAELSASELADHILRDAGVEPEFDPAAPMVCLEKAAAAGTADRVTLAVRAVRAMVAAGADAGVLAEARAYVKRTRLLTAGEFRDLCREARREEVGYADSASMATMLVQLAEANYTFGVGEAGEPFAVPNEGPPVVAMLRGGKTSLRALLARQYFARTGRAATQQALADALTVIEGMAQEQEESRLYLRVAQHDGSLWLDLGDTTGRAVKINVGGWSVENVPPVLFRRTVLTGALPEPVPGSDIAGLWDWLNVAEPDRPLVVAALIAQLFSDQPHVVVAVFGEHGTGKTTAVKVMVSLLDPSPVPVRKPPRDADSWVTAAAGSWVVALDNLSDIPPWLSDSLCRASTGDGDVRRKLYADSDLAVFAFRRCIIFDAIDVGALAPDLADRTLPVVLTPIADERRQDEETFWAEWQAEHPQLTGALLDLAVKVLRRLPTVQLDRKPRMADFARILAAVDAELSTDALARYASQAADLAADSLSGDPFGQRILATVGEPFEGTSAELLAFVSPPDDSKRPKGWPADARAATSRMRRLAPAFRKAGWTVVDLGRGGHDKQVRWQISPAPRTEMSRNDACARPQRPHEEDDAGVAGISGHLPGTHTSVTNEESACDRHAGTGYGPRRDCAACESMADR
jgi:hypothetical protein